MIDFDIKEKNIIGGIDIKNKNEIRRNILIQLKDFKKNILKLSYGKKKHYLVKII